jgi:hypothetical protein
MFPMHRVIFPVKRLAKTLKISTGEKLDGFFFGNKKVTQKRDLRNVAST